MSRRPAPRPGEEQTHIEAARRFNHSSSLMALSVLADSGIEHYRRSFKNVAMYTPLLSATLSMFAGLHGGLDRRAKLHPLRHGTYLFAAAVGLADTGFHLYNVANRTDGWNWNNLFYAAPLGAPTALLLSGGLGAIGEHLRDQPADQPRLVGMPAGKALALAVSAGLIGTVGEVRLLHFRGAFQHPAMYAPAIIPPVTAALMVAGRAGPSTAATVDSLVVEADHLAGPDRRGVPCPRHRALPRRLAQLEPEHPERLAAAWLHFD